MHAGLCQPSGLSAYAQLLHCWRISIALSLLPHVQTHYRHGLHVYLHLSDTSRVCKYTHVSLTSLQCCNFVLEIFTHHLTLSQQCVQCFYCHMDAA